ncbi:MAG TPA: hypothetical protein V6D17_19045, partial [Candidatus Obscuribacterales bacterium]
LEGDSGMCNRTTLNGFLSTLAFLSAFTFPLAQAQEKGALAPPMEPVQAKPAPSLKGQVTLQKNVGGEGGQQLQSGIGALGAPNSALSGAAQEEEFFGRKMKGRRDRRRLDAGTKNQLLTGNADDAPYIWCQSVLGGYYDQSGVCKEVIPGYRLKDYGGRFVDGTPVPKHNVKMNEAGHVWWEGDLSRNFEKIDQPETWGRGRMAP